MKIKIDELLFKPHTTTEKVNIHGLMFHNLTNSPKLYVFKSPHPKSFFKHEMENISFDFGWITYELEDVLVYFQGDLIFMECKSWAESCNNHI